jgi:hypothetical protein
MPFSPRVSAARLELALDKLKSSDWERFERLCSAFLATEFPGIRTMASAGGDRGRDAELYTDENEPNALFQYAVRKDWEVKIRETLRRLATEFPTTTNVIFMSSHQIGAKGDPYRQTAKRKGIALDIRDRSWFLERVDADDARNAASAELARVVVDAYLADAGIITGVPVLDGQEARTALVFLELQAKDDNTAKGFTKSCYESLVKASLQGTTSENRKTRSQVHSFISILLPRHNPAQLAPFIDAALNRLDRGAVKCHVKSDEFHMAFDEVERTKDRVAGLALLQDAFYADACDIAGLTIIDDSTLSDRSITIMRSIVESYFYRLGEEFAQSVAGGREVPLHTDLLRSITYEMAPTGKVTGSVLWVDFLLSAVTSLISSPSSETLEFFRVLSTAYTLFAFLAEVPDVQRATKKLFERGTLWFDTTVLLPLFAEQAFPDDMRPFTDLMVQLKRTGLVLRATPGVIEEIESHLNLCKHYLRTEKWLGWVPYVYQRFALAGGTPSRFAGWLEQFFGDFRPQEDLAEWLGDVAGIEASDPPGFDGLPKDVVDEIRAYWQGVQDERRGDTEGSGVHNLRLAEHDTENYLSVIVERRSLPANSAIGFSSWLVTMDSAAWRLKSKVSRSTADLIKHTPVISLDFLLKYLSFGPRRDMVEPKNRGHTRVFTSAIYENIPPELIKAADHVRQSYHDLDERRIQRRVRDELDRRKMSAGEVQQGGLEGVDAALASMF